MRDLFGYEPPPKATGYPHTEPGHRGVDTSVAAADFIAPYTGRQQRKILEYLAERGRPALRTTICADLGIKEQSACGRLRELELKGAVRKGEAVRGESDRPAHVYLITDAGRRAVTE